MVGFKICGRLVLSSLSAGLRTTAGLARQRIPRTIHPTTYSLFLTLEQHTTLRCTASTRVSIEHHYAFRWTWHLLTASRESLLLTSTQDLELHHPQPPSLNSPPHSRPHALTASSDTTRVLVTSKAARGLPCFGFIRQSFELLRLLSHPAAHSLAPSGRNQRRECTCCARMNSSWVKYRAEPAAVLKQRL